MGGKLSPNKSIHVYRRTRFRPQGVLSALPEPLWHRGTLLGRGTPATTIRGQKGPVVAPSRPAGLPPTFLEPVALPPNPVEALVAHEAATQAGLSVPTDPSGLSREDITRIVNEVGAARIIATAQDIGVKIGMDPKDAQAAASPALTDGRTSPPPEVVDRLTTNYGIEFPRGGHSGIAIQGARIRVGPDGKPLVPGAAPSQVSPLQLPPNLEAVVNQIIDAIWDRLTKKLDSSGLAVSGDAATKTVTNASNQLIVAENKSRRGLIIYNESNGADVRLKIGSSGSNVTATSGFLLRAGDSLNLTGGKIYGQTPLDLMFYGSVYAIRTGSTNVALSILEW